MKKIKDLIVPSLDSVDYRSRERKKFFVSSYIETSFLEKAKQSNCYYFVGEKGTGKTALAFHFENSSPDEISAKLISISETQYVRFIKLKENGKLDYTDYSIIWRATILYLMAKLAIDKSKRWHHKINGKFKKIEEAIKKFDADHLIPELEYVIQFASSLTSEAEIGAEVPDAISASLTQTRGNSQNSSTTKIKAALLECESILKTALSGIKFSKDIVLFLDGLDTKPNEVDSSEFKKCLIGLSEAAWHLNSEYFSTIKDSIGRMRCVLLLRPDVFDSLNLHNSNCKLSDNSVIFHWHTTDERHLASDLYRASDRYFSSQNDVSIGWANYFGEPVGKSSASFKHMLKTSFHRPRDMLSAVKILIGINLELARGGSEFFSADILRSSKFTDEYSEYLLGEAKNYANYYITNAEFEEMTSFFQYLNGRTKFNFDDFREAYNKFSESHGKSIVKKFDLASTPLNFLQFWYDVNIIGYIELSEYDGSKFFHWSFRERSASKIMPKVKENCMYSVHDGVAKALNLGQRFESVEAKKRK